MLHIHPNNAVPLLGLQLVASEPGGIRYYKKYLPNQAAEWLKKSRDLFKQTRFADFGLILLDRAPEKVIGR